MMYRDFFVINVLFSISPLIYSQSFWAVSFESQGPTFVSWHALALDTPIALPIAP
jgi:hypothetical protein